GCSTRLMSDPTDVSRATGSTVPAGSVTTRSLEPKAARSGLPAVALAEAGVAATAFACFSARAGLEHARISARPHAEVINRFIVRSSRLEDCNGRTRKKDA